jgi:hypothetical protein
MKTLLFLATLLSMGIASAHIPVTESATIMDANLDGSNFAGNYRVKDECDGGLFKKPNSSGLVMVKFDTSYENEVAGIKTKHAELSYTYLRKQGGNKFEVKPGKMLLNKLRKLTEVKKIDGQVVDSKTRYQVDSIDVSGDLADDDKDGSYAVTINDDGSIRIQGKDCDQRVTLTPTTDTVP